MSIEKMNHVIEATEIKEKNRLMALPQYFGQHMMLVESAIFNCMDEISPDYTAAMWHFYALDNGGFYMSPSIDKRMNIMIDGNFFDGEMSANAAGIVACLFVYSQMSSITEYSFLSNYFHLLRDYALDHKEAGQIFSAID